MNFPLNSGRSDALAALALTVLLIAAISAYLWFVPGRAPDGDTPGEATPPPAVSDTGAGDTPPDAPPVGVKPPKEAARTEAPSPTTAKPPAPEPSLRLFGTVRDASSAPLEGIHLRWIPAAASAVRKHRHDPAFIGDPIDLKRVSDPVLRNYLSRSLATASSADGTYELEVPRTPISGIVVASGAGFKTSIRAVDPSDPTGSNDPVAGVAREPAAEPEALQPFEKLSEVQIDFTLESAASVAGKVTDAVTGEPARGVVVLAGIVEPGKPAMFVMVERDAPHASVGADGTYVIQGLPPGEYRVIPRTGESDYAPFLTRDGKRVTLEKGTAISGVDFEVQPGGRIHGLVIGMDEKPLQGARLKILPSDAMTSATKGEIESLRILDESVRSEADGSFEFRGLSLEKSYRVVAREDGLAPESSEAVKLTEEESVAEVTLSLAPGGSISGHVYNADGTSAAGKDIRVSTDFGKIIAGDMETLLRMEVKAKSDENGAFTLEDLRPGTYELYAGKFKPFDVFGSEQKTTKVTLEGRVDVTGVQIVLTDTDASASPEQRLAGVVVDDSGSPIADASVKVTSATDFLKTSPTKSTSGADGRFVVNKLSGTTFNIAVEKSGYVKATAKSVAVNTENVALVLQRFARVSGKVVTPDGSPPAGGKVEARPVREESGTLNFEELAKMVSDAKSALSVSKDGSFSLEAPPGKVRVRATVPGYAPTLSDVVTVTPGEERAGIEIRVTAGATLRGRVTLAGRNPVEGAKVSLRPFMDGPASYLSELMPQFFAKDTTTVTTDAEGYYEMARLAPGKYSVMARHSEYAASDKITVTLAQDQVWDAAPLALSVGASISGKVIVDGRGKPGMMVGVLGTSPIQQAVTDQKGEFHFRGLRIGEYLLNVLDMAGMRSGNMAMKQHHVALTREDVHEVEVVFGLGNKVYGTIKGLPPSATPMRVVTLRRPGGPAPEEVSPLDMKASVEAGKYQAGIGFIKEDKYTISDIEPGEYILEVPRMPANPTDFAAYEKMDRTPYFRKKIKVEQRNLELDIVISSS